jgi:transposase
LDLAKLVFQVHGADASGAVVFRKTLRRARVLEFFRDLPRCVVAMEACGGAHHWAREIGRLGHEVRLIPPIYVKPFVKRQKNDASDAEAICEAAQRPTMRFVAVKSESAQASAAIFRTRDLLVRQRTQLINAVRGQLTEYGLVAAKGTANLPRLLALVDERGSDLPQATRAMLDVLIGMVMMLAEQISALDREIARRAKEEDMPSRLMTIPGVGQSRRQPSRLLLRRWRRSAKGATSPPGSA